MEKVKVTIEDYKDSRVSSLKDFYSYRDMELQEVSIWTKNKLDHIRLPGNIDITEFLIYMRYRFYKWLDEIKFNGEKPLFTPIGSDIVLSQEGYLIEQTVDSPHRKIPWFISYKVSKRYPMSTNPPFGSDKRLKYMHCGYFQEDDGTIYEMRLKEWENLVEFVIGARSYIEADAYTRLFEGFIISNIMKFQEAGVERVVQLSRLNETKEDSKNLGIHFRKLHYWIPTQEFHIRGPVDTIKQIAVNVELSDI
jgi:hypothetical protein